MLQYTDRLSNVKQLEELIMIQYPLSQMVILVYIDRLCVKHLICLPDDNTLSQLVMLMYCMSSITESDSVMIQVFNIDLNVTTQLTLLQKPIGDFYRHAWM